jgi:hypothetical protein
MRSPGATDRWKCLAALLFVSLAACGTQQVIDASPTTGIVSWQQQVPLPQDYTGSNAFQFTYTSPDGTVRTESLTNGNP